MPRPAAARPPVRRSRKRKLLIFAGVVSVALAGLVGLGVAYLYFSYAQLNNSVPADAWIGECYARSDSQRPVDCSGPHHYEVYSAGVFDRDVEYPGRIDRIIFGLDLCEEDFEAYTGDSPMSLTSDYQYDVRYPSSEGWDRGERYVLCVLSHAEGRELDGLSGIPLGP